MLRGQEYNKTFSFFFEKSKKKLKNLSLKSLLQQGYFFPSHAIQAVPKSGLYLKVLGIVLSKLVDCLQWPPTHDGSESRVDKSLLGGRAAMWEALLGWCGIDYLYIGNFYYKTAFNAKCKASSYADCKSAHAENHCRVHYFQL